MALAGSEAWFTAALLSLKSEDNKLWKWNTFKRKTSAGKNNIQGTLNWGMVIETFLFVYNPVKFIIEWTQNAAHSLWEQVKRFIDFLCILIIPILQYYFVYKDNI